VETVDHLLRDRARPSHTLNSGFSYLGRAEEGAGFGDRALRLDPRMTPANLSGVHDAYYMAQRYEGQSPHDQHALVQRFRWKSPE
jgi:hypothetical protein